MKWCYSIILSKNRIVYRKSAINVPQWVFYDDIKCNFYDVTRIWMTLLKEWRQKEIRVRKLHLKFDIHRLF